jgi:hypothetical protein
MFCTIKRVLVSCTAIAVLAAGSAVVASPAGAEVSAKNTKFCKALTSNQGAGINFNGLGPAEAKFADKLLHKLANTGVPAKLKSDLLKVAKVYNRIAKGEDAATVIRETTASLGKALTRFTKYVASNCSPSVPST